MRLRILCLLLFLLTGCGSSGTTTFDIPPVTVHTELGNFTFAPARPSPSPSPVPSP